MVICTPIGAITIGVIMDRIGRKNAFLLTCVLLLISWSIASMVHRENISLIYLCRFFAGIGGGNVQLTPYLMILKFILLSEESIPIIISGR